MKKIKKELLLNKYIKIKKLKNIIKFNIIRFFIHNNNLTLKNKSIFLFLNNINQTKDKRNLCLFTSRKNGLNRFTNLSRLKFRKLAKSGLINNFKIN